METPRTWNVSDRMDEILTPIFSKLTGFIFNYDKNSGLNLTLFQDYLWVVKKNLQANSSWVIEETSETVFPKHLNWDSFVLSAKVKLLEKRDEFDSIRQDLESDVWKKELWDKYEFYVKNFDKIAVFFDLLELYIPIEAEKIFSFQDDWDDFAWEWWEKADHLQRIEDLEEEIFWKKLYERTNHARTTIKDIYRNFDENWGELSESDEKFFHEVMWEIETVVDDNSHEDEGIQVSQEGSSKEVINLEDPLLWIEWLDKEVLDKEISQKDFVEVFKLAWEILWIEWFEVKLEEKRTNFEVMDWNLLVPTSYKKLKVSRIIGMIAHELERHAIGDKNNDKLIWNLRSLSYMWQEEWVAHIMEHLALWYSLDEMPLNRYMSRMLAWEILDGDRFKRFLHIMNTLDSQSINVEDFFLRFKRGKDFDLPGVNPKEKHYGMWALETIDRIRAKHNPLSFFLAKNWEDEQGLVDSIVNPDGWEITPKMLRDKWIVLPLMLGELLRFSLVNPNPEQSWEKVMWRAIPPFLLHFKQRYWELFNDLWINYRSFVWNYIKSVRWENKGKVEKILDIIKSSENVSES